MKYVFIALIAAAIAFALAHAAGFFPNITSWDFRLVAGIIGVSGLALALTYGK